MIFVVSQFRYGWARYGEEICFRTTIMSQYRYGVRRMMNKAYAIIVVIFP